MIYSKFLSQRKRKLKTLVILVLLIVPIVINSTINFSIPVDSKTIHEEEKENNNFIITPSATSVLSWWNESWNYRVRIDVQVQNRSVVDVPINKRINFTELLYDLNDYQALDWDSIRIVEYNSSTETWVETNCTVYEYVGTSSASDYNALTNAVVDLTWLLEGTTVFGEDNRTYFVYFDSLANPFTFPARDYGFNQVGSYGAYGTKNLIYGDYFRFADFSASSAELDYRDGDSHYGSINNPFDNVYGGNPYVVEDNEYEGKVGRVLDIPGRQAHAGSDQRFHMEFYWSGIYKDFPIIKCAIKVDDPYTRTSLYVYTDSNWRVIFYTPDAEYTQGGYIVDHTYGSEIICDGNWHIYEYDLRRISGTSRATQIEFYQNTGAPNSHYFYFDNLMAFTTDTTTANQYSTGGDIVYDLPLTYMFAPELKRSTVKINALDVNDNPIQNVNVTMYNGTQTVATGNTDQNGQVIFTEIEHADYNFTATITSTVEPYTTLLVNSTYSIGAITIEYVFQEINLTCNVGTNWFEIKDVDGLELDSGWIVVGNDTQDLQYCSINSAGNATFWWLDAAPNTYNYSVYYFDENYNPSTVLLATGDIGSANDVIQLVVNLTTVTFEVKAHGSGEVVTGAEVLLTKDNPSGDTIVNLTTDENGTAIMRWLNSSGIGGNYSLQINFFGIRYIQNNTLNSLTGVLSFNFSVSTSMSVGLWFSITLEDYKTNISSLNPIDSIKTQWGSQVRLRALFNVTKAGGSTSLVGVQYADSMQYRIKKGTIVIMSGPMVREPNKIGAHYAIIDTTDTRLSLNLQYSIEIIGYKSGYTLPSPLTGLTFVVESISVILNQSENDDSTQFIQWAEDVSMSVKSYSTSEELMGVNMDLLINENNEFSLSFPEVVNDWNLTSVEFQILDIQWSVLSESLIGATIVDPYGGSHVFNYIDGDYDFNAGTWNLPAITLNKQSITSDNNFDFIISGTFLNAINITADCLFTRDSVDMQISIFNVSSDFIIPADNFGWTIKNITFDLINCYDSTTWTPITPSSAGLCFIDNNNKSHSFVGSSTTLIVDDGFIFPEGGLFQFRLQNSTPVCFNSIIYIEYAQSFFENPLLETYSLVLSEIEFNNGDTFTISPEGDAWSGDTSILVFENISNYMGDYAPEDVDMKIRVGTSEYTVYNNPNNDGKHELSLLNLGFLPNTIYHISIITNTTVDVSLSLNGGMRSIERKSIPPIIGSVSYQISGTSLKGSIPYLPEQGLYLLTLDTSVIDAGVYTVTFTFVKSHYDIVSKALNIEVENRRTTINGTAGIFQSNFDVYIGSEKLFYFNYADFAFNSSIAGSEKKYCRIDGFDDISLVDLGNGTYLLDIDTETKSNGTYSLTVYIKKRNYEERIATIVLRILPRQFQSSFSTYMSIVSGNNLIVSISLKDLERGTFLNESSVYTILGSKRYNFTDNGDGTYISPNLPTPNAFFTSNNFILTIVIQKENYETQYISIFVEIRMAEIFPGFPTFWFIMLVGSIVAVIGSLGTYKYVQLRRIPKFIKKGKALIKAINSKGSLSKSMGYPSKEDFLAKMFEDRWKIHDLSLRDKLGVIKDKKLGKTIGAGAGGDLKNIKGGDDV